MVGGAQALPYADYVVRLEKRPAGADPMFCAILDATGKAVGTAAYQR
ncbi:MAG: hypothetical protein K0R38_6815 [Polyangiaceae bacterium]|nr:hypothetical protein [Polyangiaceae bacterium]